MNFEEQIWCILSQAMSFETFTPIESHINEDEKMAKLQYLIFYNYLYNSVETLPRNIHEF